MRFLIKQALLFLTTLLASAVTVRADSPLPIPQSLPAACNDLVVRRVTPSAAVVAWSCSATRAGESETRVQFYRLEGAKWKEALSENIDRAYNATIEDAAPTTKSGPVVVITVQYGAAAQELRTYLIGSQKVTHEQSLISGMWEWCHADTELYALGLPESPVDNIVTYRWSGSAFVVAPEPIGSRSGPSRYASRAGRCAGRS